MFCITFYRPFTYKKHKVVQLYTVTYNLFEIQRIPPHRRRQYLASILSFTMVCPFGFVSAAIFLGPMAVKKVSQFQWYEQVAVYAGTVVVGGWLVNQALVVMSG